MLYKGIVKINGVKCKQITRPKAEKLHDLGIRIWLHPCNLRLNNDWQTPYSYQRSETNTECFESLYTTFGYYNCDKERGRRILCFASVFDLERAKR
jgi:hypothetical protein